MPLHLLALVSGITHDGVNTGRLIVVADEHFVLQMPDLHSNDVQSSCGDRDALMCFSLSICSPPPHAQVPVNYASL